MKQKVIGNLDRGLLFVLSAPAGTGKSTLVSMLLKEFPDEIAQSCSVTTRSPRANEVNRLHYQFCSLTEFETMIKQHEFVEYAKLFGDYYGTKKSEVEGHLKKKKHLFLVIDTQGAMQLIGKIDAIFIFLLPPSFEELRARLFKRRTEDETKIQERLMRAKEEVKMAEKYDYQIVNDELEVAYQVLKSIIIAEEHKSKVQSFKLK